MSIVCTLHNVNPLRIIVFSEGVESIIPFFSKKKVKKELYNILNVINTWKCVLKIIPASNLYFQLIEALINVWCKKIFDL